MIEREWKAQWITDLSYVVEDKESPTPMTFEKTLLTEKPIKRATLFASAVGIYQFFIDGKKVGNEYFAPGFTSYEHQLQYQKHDVTDLIGSNSVLSAVVGGGWAVGRFTYACKNKLYADRQAFLAEIEIEYEDGAIEIVATDTSWKVTEKGCFVYADWYNGETFDATAAITASDYRNAEITNIKETTKLYEQYGAPVIAHECLKPISHFTAKSGEEIYDFGQNFAGVISAKIYGELGQKIVIRHAEVLLNDELFIKSLRSAKATATYICKDGEQKYSPTMTYMGFRYIGVSGIKPENIEIEGIALYSDIQEIGSFECSNEDINKLQSNIKWGGKSNFVDIPTDCPQRDERMGWTGDISVFASTACFNFDTSKFFDKWLLDMKKEQSKAGGIPMVIPKLGDGWPVLTTSCWGDSCVLVPWAEYLARGDKELLARQYPVIVKFLGSVKRWAEFLSIGKTSRRIWTLLYHFGDWCAPGESAVQWVLKGRWVGTAYFANSCRIGAEIAEILDKPTDKEYYLKLRKEICEAYVRRFTEGKGKLKKEFQTAYVLPLYFDMADENIKKAMAANLVELLKKSDYHLSTGFTGTPYLLFALSDNGYADVAYKVLLQDTCPSWLYEVKSGGTTIWERWDALRPDGTVNIGDLTGKKDDDASGGGMVSFNHYANGAVGDWLYRRIAGIEATSGGYKTFNVKPIIGGGLTYAKASTLSPYGTIVSDWKIQNDVFTLAVTVPDGTTATVTLPDGKSETVEGGVHTFECKL